MKFDKKALRLYAVTDRSWLGENSLRDQVEETIRGGATLIQLREKHLGYDEFVSEAKKIKAVTDQYNVPFIINDNVKVALAVGADGVHVGQSDMPVDEVRKLIGPDMILGLSAQTAEQAKTAKAGGADYIGVGAVFSTSTKTDADSVSYETLKEICECVDLPVVAIGGISAENLMQLKGSGIDGVAVVSAIFAQPDIFKATQKLAGLVKELMD